jgi:hypothetical protein
MIWLTWQQHRKQALFTLIALAVVAAFMIPTGLAMRDSFADLQLPACVRGDALPTRPACGAALEEFTRRHGALFPVRFLFLFVPLLVGLFWGAPLVAREVEHGTHRLAWTQGVSRVRWSLVKFGCVGLAVLLAAAGYGIGMSWWAQPISATGSRFEPLSFDMQGLVPIGYTLVAVALGIFAGAVWPKVLPALAVTLAGFVGLRIAIVLLARPHYQPALNRIIFDPSTTSNPNQGSFTVSGEIKGGWQLALQHVDANGNLLPPDAQGNIAFGSDTYLRQIYHPAERFWPFQGIETGIYIGLALLLLYLAIRRIQRIT